MPVIKSAKKRMKQNVTRRARNFPVRSELKTLIKKELQFIKDGSLADAEKLLPSVFSIIDTACKKKIIHPNNADRKKSRVARALNELQKKGETKKEASTPEKPGKAEAKA
ncbi:MAG: 30S ribosomal protein S20 [bacterium]|nr:30S ribosomal protein S20 [bacterium]